MSWKDLNNDISVDITTLETPSNVTHTSIIASLSDTVDRVNLYPFKLVTLSWLISLGKFISDPVMIMLSGKKFYCYHNKFTGSESYLPAGDVLTPTKLSDITNPYDYPILLVANKYEYSKILPNGQSPITGMYQMGNLFNSDGGVITSVNEEYISSQTKSSAFAGTLTTKSNNVFNSSTNTDYFYTSPFFTFSELKSIGCIRF